MKSQFNIFTAPKMFISLEIIHKILSKVVCSNCQIMFRRCSFSKRIFLQMNGGKENTFYRCGRVKIKEEN